ncbi:MAG: enoyl-CoA hydratase-related protein [Cypionkella sp.]
MQAATGSGSDKGSASGPMRVDRIGSVAVFVLTNPPVNTLVGSLQQAILAALAEAENDPAVTAVIMRGEGRCFSAGADIREAGLGARAAELGVLCRRVETFAKPVIAALHGTALGAGFELALAAHYRIANAAAFVGLPEVGLGLLPAGGATQRLPRLVGAEQALRMMLTGLPIRAADAMAMGLIDRVVSEGLGEAALAMAQEGLPTRPTAMLSLGLRDAVSYQAAVAAARAADRGNPLPAPARIIDCVEAAALLPFEMGLGMEQSAFDDLADTPEAHGLHHAFVAERRALQPPAEIAGRTLPVLGSLGIWGAEDPACDLALQALTAGLRVTLCDPDRARLADALGRIAAKQEQAVVSGRMTEDARDADWARLSSSLSAEGFAGLDLVLTSPAQGAAGLSADLPLAMMGAAVTGAGITVPEAFGGLAELAIAAGATLDQIERLMALGRRLNWRVVAVGPGGPVELGLRLALDAAEQYLVRTASPEVVAAALQAYGMGQAGLHRAIPMPRGGKALVQTCLAALAAEGVRMLADGRARRPCDIDAVALLCGLMPRWHGGPMFLADQRGLLVLRADLHKLAGDEAGGEVFVAATLLDDMIAEGKRFADLDEG